MSDDKSSLDANKGSVGSAFRPDGSIGKQGQKIGIACLQDPKCSDRLTRITIGGPLDKEGAVGKEFKADGSIGGTAQNGK